MSIAVSYIANAEVIKRYKELKEFKDVLLAQKAEIIPILNDAGLTKAGAEMDLALFEKEIDSSISELGRLKDKRRLEGVFAASVPYDVPNFLGAFYIAPAYLAGYDIIMRFSGVVKPIGEIWADILKEARIPEIYVDLESSGREFGQECIRNPEIQHMILAGATPIVEQYTSPEVAQNFKRLFVLGPTSPDVIFTDSYDFRNQNNREAAIRTVEDAMHNSGQICGHYKRFIVTNRNFRDAEELFSEVVAGIDYGTPENTVGPINEKGAFEAAKAYLQRFEQSDRYKILVGGRVDEEKQLIEPTIVLAEEGIDEDISYFAPIIILAEAEDDLDAIRIANEDKRHGLLAGIYADRAEHAHKYVGELKRQHGKVLVNSTIMNSPIEWPYGGFGESFTYLSNNKGQLTTRKGTFYLSQEITEI